MIKSTNNRFLYQIIISILISQIIIAKYQREKLESYSFKGRINLNTKRLIDGLNYEICGKSNSTLTNAVPAFNCSAKSGSRLINSHCSARRKQLSSEQVDNYRYSGGFKVELGEFPSYVHLAFRNRSGYINFCGGTLIDRDLVITAAHCIKESNANAAFARVGFANERNKAYIQRTFAWAHCILPSYHLDNRTGDSEDDVALLQLREPFNYTDYVQPACLSIKQAHLDDSQCYSVGMGFTNTNQSIKSDQLLALPVKKNCTSIDLKNLKDKSCYKANKYLGGGCKSDSGGPLYCIDNCGENRLREFVVGGFSFGMPNFCNVNKPVEDLYADYFKLRINITEVLKYCHEDVIKGKT